MKWSMLHGNNAALCCLNFVVIIRSTCYLGLHTNLLDLTSPQLLCLSIFSCSITLSSVSPSFLKWMGSKVNGSCSDLPSRSRAPKRDWRLLAWQGGRRDSSVRVWKMRTLLNYCTTLLPGERSVCYTTVYSAGIWSQSRDGLETCL